MREKSACQGERKNTEEGERKNIEAYEGILIQKRLCQYKRRYSEADDAIQLQCPYRLNIR
jgi:hypothetical protein